MVEEHHEQSDYDQNGHWNQADVVIEFVGDGVVLVDDDARTNYDSAVNEALVYVVHVHVVQLKNRNLILVFIYHHFSLILITMHFWRLFERSVFKFIIKIDIE